MYNIIQHITTHCNFDCSYCDVIKDKKNLSESLQLRTLDFIKRNQSYINNYKFFGGEPFLAWKDIKTIIDESKSIIGNNYNVVTNTTCLSGEICEYLKEYFSILFFSIDSENDFNYEKIEQYTHTYQLENKLYCNLIVSPGKHETALKQFHKLHKMGIYGYNILPVYFTQDWSDADLKGFSEMMKEVLLLARKDPKIRLFGFGENSGYQTSLANNTIFIDIDGEIYYSDIVSTFKGSVLKKSLYLGNVSTLVLDKKLDIEYFNKLIIAWENKCDEKVRGQKKLKKIMDYFSKFLKNNG